MELPRQLCAVCPACCKCLDGDVAVSSCDHVFHRACLLNGGLTSCPTCGDPIVRERVQALYGVHFGAGAGQGGAAALAEAAAGWAGDGDDDVVVDSAEARIAREVAQIIRLREAVRQREEALEYREIQEQKKLKATQATKKLENQRASQEQELESSRRRYEDQLEELNRMRLRDTVLDYSERLRRDGEKPALEYLLKMVKIVQEPSKVIVDINRLREHHRRQFCDWLRESGNAKQQLSKARRELEETKRAAAELEAKLGRSAGGAASQAFTTDELMGPLEPIVQEGGLPKRQRREARLETPSPRRPRRGLAGFVEPPGFDLLRCAVIAGALLKAGVFKNSAYVDAICAWMIAGCVTLGSVWMLGIACRSVEQPSANLKGFSAKGEGEVEFETLLKNIYSVPGAVAGSSGLTWVQRDTLPLREGQPMDVSERVTSVEQARARCNRP